MKKKLLAIVGLVIVLCVALVLPLGTAFADYEDIVSDENAIVNFNQYVNNIYINNYNLPITNNTNIVGSNLVNNDIYYIYIEMIINDGLVALDFKNVSNTSFLNPIVFSSSSTLYEVVYSQSSYSQWYLNLYSTSGSNIIKYAKCINLTQMFGAGNEPTLQQCQQLFVADYYPYNLGSPISFDGMSDYVQGFNDALGSYEVSLDTTLLASTVFAANGFVNVGNTNNSITANNGSNNFEFGFYLPSNIYTGDNITISFSKLNINYNSSGNNITGIQVGYYNNGSFVALSTINISDLTLTSTVTALGSTNNIYDSYTFSFTSNSNIGTLFFRSIGTSSISIITFYDLNLKVVTTNTYYAIQSAYDSGVAKGKSYYAPGSTGYYVIYNAGYDAGVAAPTWSFKDLIAAAIDTPIIAMTNLFDFDILGVNMKTFYLSIFTLAVIITIIRLVI